MSKERSRASSFITPRRRAPATAMWMLEEVGEPYEIELLNLKTGDQRKPAYLALNPMGKVPTIVDEADRRERGCRPSAAISPMPIPRRDSRQPIGDKRAGHISSGCSTRQAASSRR